MTGRAAIERALEQAGLAGPPVTSRGLGGGCIHDVRELVLADGARVVIKINGAGRLGLFEEEAASLDALAGTGTVRVPRPLAVTAAGGAAVLLMTAIEPAAATAESWRRLGRDLAALHAADPPTPPGSARYGFEIDNHLGTTPQPNAWCDDWVRFNAEHRLGHQLRLATARNLLSGDEASAVERVIDRLDTLIPSRPKPALLHGDLWSGNALPAAGERIVVIDPACSIGDGWADIAMMRLFGGFSESCFEVYAAGAEDRDDVETRIAVYQLYHLLNHVNLFGRGYVGQAMALARALR